MLDSSQKFQEVVDECAASRSNPAFQLRGKVLPADSTVPEAARLLLIVRRLNVHYLHERSFKVVDGAILCNRFLVSFHKNFMGPKPRDTLLSVCEQLDAPNVFLQKISAIYPDADVFHIGFEEGLHTRTYKLYLEHANRFQRAVKDRRSEPLLVHLAFKWDPKCPEKRVIARYTSRPSLTVQKMIDNLLLIYDHREEAIPYICAVQLLSLASKRMHEKNILFMEVEEENNPRRSFDINIYDAKITLKEIDPLLSPIMNYFDIPEGESRKLLRSESEQIVGHLSGGIGRDGKEFCSVYYGVEWR